MVKSQLVAGSMADVAVEAVVILAGVIADAVSADVIDGEAVVAEELMLDAEEPLFGVGGFVISDRCRRD